MGSPSTAVLLEKFQNHTKTLDERIESMKILSTTEGKIRPLTRANPASLLTLPLEIRLQIYHYCIPRKRIIEVSGPHFHGRWSLEEEASTQEVEEEANTFDNEEEADTQHVEEMEDDTQVFESGTQDIVLDLWNINKSNNGLFLVSKQIGEEALDLLYGENIFKLCVHGDGEYFLRKNFSERNRRRTRYILVIAQPMGASFRPEQKPDNALWSSILPDLKAFRLVLQQPLEAAGYYNAPTLEQEMDRWVK